MVNDFGEKNHEMARARHVIKIEVGDVNRLKFLGSMVQRNYGLEKDVRNRIMCGWMNCGKASDILCDKIMPLRLKDRFYKAVVKPAVMQHGSER